MSVSKAWDWKKNSESYWLTPSEESYYFSSRWKELKFKDLLDFGCGLGRHSIFFAKNGFNVSAFDLSKDGVGNLKNWAKSENVSVKTQVSDMLNLDYPENSFDCIFAYHVISHTDTKGMIQIVSEIEKILKPGGEIFLSLCSKETWSFKEANFPKIDENTIIKNNSGPEKDIPHFYVSLDDIIKLFSSFKILKIRHTDDCYFEGRIQNSKHFYILLKKPEMEENK